MSSSSSSFSTITSPLFDNNMFATLRRSSSFSILVGGNKGKGKEVLLPETNSNCNIISLDTSKKLVRRRITKSNLDFGCIGEKLEFINEAKDEGNYSHHVQSISVSSLSSSNGTLPSLTHSRNSSYDTTPPLSPSTSSHDFPSSPSSSKSSDSHRSKEDEGLAIDALNEYFARVRLSRIEEPVYSSRSISPSVTSTCRLSTATLSNNRPFSTTGSIRTFTTGRSPSPIIEGLPYEDNSDKDETSTQASDLDELSEFFSSSSRSNSRCGSERGISSTTSYPESLFSRASSDPSIYSRYSSRSKRGLVLQTQDLSMNINKLKEGVSKPYGWI